MRLLHTSDWHLGRTLHGVDLLGHQAEFVDHLVGLVREADVDAVVVSGDVYDRAVPPVEAVALLTEALARLAEHATVVVTPGNHDSAVRLGFAAPLLRAGVHVRTRVADVGRPVELQDEHGPVVVHALPYLDPDSVRRELAEEVDDDGSPRLLARSHEAVTGAAMRRVRADLASRTGDRPRSVVMAHAFVVGGAASESERDIRVGGVDAVPAGVFDGVDYVALGHLHGPQRLTGPGAAGPVLQYSGSPLAYSFSEMRQRKGTVLLTLGPDGVQGAPELVPAPVPRRLSEVTGTLDELLGDRGSGHAQDWVRVVVTDDVRPTDLYPRVRARFPHALVVEHRPAGQAHRPTAGVVTAARDPLDVVGDFVSHVTATPPTTAEAAVLRRAYEAVLAGERSD
ncbi:metallophosphoesterase family protein [Cellulomonas bogoriensis]|uniref:Nuclease SbcCD subunit D n=1 Tax=Cellulomonas bogoriensis 69B4 = DSM 16987 TaxID=1386082 RepID=A0A0A0BXT0_9CELL|nr:exonuclease SbcCD subunit D C-terminal domain-containing protein [Cellulomonas bogoriensis]KGM13198.1 exodeoxyribonuclease I [Cellulomonas bogoriensis 69B4 = DSM 16987]